jgi:hypothetical protein
MESPSVVLVADGSIDFHWKLSDRELLVNISPTDDKWATYYGGQQAGWNIVVDNAILWDALGQNIPERSRPDPRIERFAAG